MTLDSRNSIRESFSRAASTYQAAAVHQFNIARHLVDIFHYDKHAVSEGQNIIDLGSGTGFVSQIFEQQFKHSTVMRLDLCESMLKADSDFCAQKNFICGDIQAIPLQKDSLDYCISSYAFQWASDLGCLFEELARTLKQDACVYFSMPGSLTFEELKQAWKAVDDDVHVHSFVHQDHILEAAAQQGFECLHFSQAQDVLEFESQRAALSHIKNIGAHNLDQNRVKHLTGKTPYFAFSQAFKQHSKVAGAYSLSYHSYFFGFRLKSKHA